MTSTGDKEEIIEEEEEEEDYPDNTGKRDEIADSQPKSYDELINVLLHFSEKMAVLLHFSRIERSTRWMKANFCKLYMHGLVRYLITSNSLYIEEVKWYNNETKKS